MHPCQKSRKPRKNTFPPGARPASARQVQDLDQVQGLVEVLVLAQNQDLVQDLVEDLAQDQDLVQDLFQDLVEDRVKD